jgi:hypothetical protein
VGGVEAQAARDGDGGHAAGCGAAERPRASIRCKRPARRRVPAAPAMLPRRRAAATGAGEPSPKPRLHGPLDRRRPAAARRVGGRHFAFAPGPGRGALLLTAGVFSSSNGAVVRGRRAGGSPRLSPPGPVPDRLRVSGCSARGEVVHHRLQPPRGRAAHRVGALGQLRRRRAHLRGDQAAPVLAGRDLGECCELTRY